MTTPVPSGSLSPRRMRDRAAQRNPLPEGTLAVGVGLILNGLAAYAFLSIARRVLGEDQFASLSLLWFTTFILAPGFFLPIEQEVGRALAHRRALGQGGLPVARKAAVLGLAMVGTISVFLVVLGRVISDQLFHGNTVLVACLILSFIAYALAHFTRGVLAGSGRFGPYGVVMGAEGVLRVALCIVCAVAGVEALGVYGLLIGLPPFFAVALALRKERHLLEPGPNAEWGEITPNLGWLLCGSVLAAALVNAGPLAAALLATDEQKTLVSQFSAGVLIARVPLFLFQAVQAALLPKLTRLAATGALTEFRRGFRKLMFAVIAVGVVGILGAATFGPWALKVFFDSELTRRTLTLLALSSALYMVAVATAQALIALRAHARVALGWACGMGAFIVVTAIGGSDLLLRVELGLVAGSLAAAIAFALSLRPRMAKPIAVSEEQMVEALFDLPIE